ncbi:MAG: hypothetical protein QXL32_05155, partial [Candidatus Bathyarchaeia archaeon]
MTEIFKYFLFHFINEMMKKILSKSAITKTQATILIGIIVIIAIVGIAYYATLPPPGPPPPAPKPVIKVGLLWPVTGALALIGRDQ